LLTKKQVFIITSLFFLTAQNLFSQSNNPILKAVIMYRICENVIWPEKSIIDTFAFALVSTDTQKKQYFSNSLSSKKLNGKPILIHFYHEVNQVPVQNYQVVYFDSVYNSEIDDILADNSYKGILFFTENYHDKSLLSINLKDNIGKINFEINRSNIKIHQLRVADNLVLLGGDEIDVRELYKQQEAILLKEREKFDNLITENKKLKLAVDSNLQLIANQQLKLSNQQLEIKQERDKLLNLETAISEQSNLLKNKQSELSQTLQQLKFQRNLFHINKEEESRIRNRISELRNTQKENEITIKKQDISIISHVKLIREQRIYLSILFIVILAIILLLAFLIRSMQIRKAINLSLQQKNDEIQNQNIKIVKQHEEIELQTLLLMQNNKELQKLSTVVAKTDNSVAIISTIGTIEWVNEGFKRLRNLSYEQVIDYFGTAYADTLSNANIESLIANCLLYQKSVIFESPLITDDTQTEQWIQTTLSPVVDDNGNITNLIAIDSDITKIKNAEKQIIQANEILLKQHAKLLDQKEKIEQQNFSITSSINYALTIQQAILPTASETNKFFNSFLIYYPKDIVSGDFYWFNHLPAKENKTEKIYAAVIDCTGHGVPGAFMSLIGSRLLNEIVNEKKITSPKNILAILDNMLKKVLRQETEERLDGMDVCMCRIEKNAEKYLITFSGAKRPLYYFKKSENVLNRIHGDRITIGGFNLRLTDDHFIHHEIVLQSGDLLYLSSDGLIDQNSPERKRFGSERLIKTLNFAATVPFNKQKEMIEKEMASFRNNELQRDDITLWGINLI